MGQDTIQSVSAVTDVPIPKLFDFLRVPANHVRMDGSGQLVSADLQPIEAVGDVFTVQVSSPERGEYVVENHVVAFIADAQIAWLPAAVGKEPSGLRWEWVFDVGAHGETIITQTCDWSQASADYLATRSLPMVTADEMRLSIRRLIELVSSTIRLT